MRVGTSRSGARRARPERAKPVLAITIGAAMVIGLLGAGLVGTSAASAPVARCSDKPDASNTGASGKRVTSKVAALTKSESTLKNARLTGSLTVSGNGVTVRNVSVNGQVIVTGDHVTLDRVTARSVIVSAASHVTVRRSNLSGGGTAVYVTSKRRAGHTVRQLRLIANYIHDPASSALDSYSGTQLRGAQGVTISCSNYALAGYGKAAILMEDVNGGTSKVTVSRNWLDGGGFTVVTGAKRVALRSNVFGSAAKYGTCRDTSGGSVSESRNRTREGLPLHPCRGRSQSPDSSSASPTATTTTSTGTAPRPAATTAKPTPKESSAASTVRPSLTASNTFEPNPKPSSTESAATAGSAAPANSSCAFKPSAATTGASGSRRSSSVKVLTDGQTLQNADVGSGIEIRGNNVTVRNVSVAGNILVTGDNAMIDHVTAQGVAISSASGTTVQYANIGNSKEDGIHVTSDRGRMIRNAVLRYNYVHDPRVPSDAHYDGIQVRGVDGLTIDCSVYDPGEFQWTLNAAVYLEDANGGHSNVRVSNNWLYGHAFPVMVDAGKSSTFTKNRIGGDIKWDTCYPGKGLSSSNFTSSGNVWDTSNAELNLCGIG
jgi:hypothetical protein